MFGRKQPEVVDTSTEQPTEATGPQAAKGRKTPSRREAEAARKQQLTTPKDPKQARKASRDRARAERGRSRAGMMAGDERYFPPRDQGPARAFTRDFVDARFTLAEFFIFVAVGVLGLSFVRSPAIQSLASLAFLLVSALIVVDTLVLLFQLHRRAREMFPDPVDRKGLTLYAVLRSLQLRRFRVPAARVRRNGTPVAPKKPKV